LAAAPAATVTACDLSANAVTIGSDDELDESQQAALRSALMNLHPWRKGPFHVFGINVDAEWRSDLKWSRLAPHIAPLTGRRVLDVGCGNGYYALRMLGSGAETVVGIDPTLRFIAQFQMLSAYLPEAAVALLPLRGEDLPLDLKAFDTVFSMGVLYHRRSPLDHLLELKQALKPGGQLVLETLIMPEAYGQVLMPEDRYAKMRNVWFLPSQQMLALWLSRCGFRNPRIVDISTTTNTEQRRTDWMQFESLADFLDPNDLTLTVEGYPAPMRAIALAEV